MGEACPCILVTVAGYLVATVQPSANAACAGGAPEGAPKGPILPQPASGLRHQARRMRHGLTYRT